MRKTRTEGIGSLIQQYLRETGLETPLNEHRVIQAWSTVAGPVMAKYTLDLKIYNQVLFVQVSSAAVRNELMMRRTELVARLNAQAGAQVITQIVLR
ncbi:MAG: DUF721 domain-containing protein [Bacteroidaceae bacterium]|nr:DUF721 domain-containing protein [Candidatus Colenecus caballi]MCQ2073469.1 DUF721 domain-containing protein [Bacteroidaceae bacterium]